MRQTPDKLQVGVGRLVRRKLGPLYNDDSVKEVVAKKPPQPTWASWFRLYLSDAQKSSSAGN